MLNISPLTLGYADKSVLYFAGMQLADGSQCLITGVSGSGKTSLIYAIAGLIRPISGHITLNGTDISTLSESACDQFRGQHIGIIFQTLHLVKSLSVIDNLRLASYVSGFPVQEAHTEQALKALNIFDKKDHLPEQLSQGQAQRVAIGRAIMHNPALILADEPTSSLDDASCEAVINVLKQVANDTGATLLISTHDSRVKAHFSNVIQLGDAA